MGALVARPPPPPPPPDEGLRQPVLCSIVVLCTVCFLFLSGSLAERHGGMWNPVPPHYAYLAARAWQWYKRMLTQQPRATSSVSGAFLAAMGNRIGCGSYGVSTLKYAIWGLVACNISSTWLSLLDRGFAGASSPKMLLNKIVVDVVVSVALLRLAFQLVHGVLDGTPLDDVVLNIRTNFWAGCMPGWQFWTPIVAVAHLLVPVEIRVVFFSAAALVWNAIQTVLFS